MVQIALLGVDTFEAIRCRRSISRLAEPAPTEEELHAMIEAAVYAPDHKDLRPWRFILLRDDNKTQFGEYLVNALVKREPAATEGQIEKERNKLQRAPLVIAVGCKRIESKLPFEEMFAACAAATQNLLLAATDLGYGTIWRTGNAAHDPNVKKALGLDEHDALLGFIYIGTFESAPQPKTVKIDDVVSSWSA